MKTFFGVGPHDDEERPAKDLLREIVDAWDIEGKVSPTPMHRTRRAIEMARAYLED